ncbi:hypothetical protein ACWIHY_33245, partial [Streptomyces sp. NPDC055287]
MTELEHPESKSRFDEGLARSFKNVFFAPVGPKPEIVLRDTMNNDVEIVGNAGMSTGRRGSEDPEV